MKIVCIQFLIKNKKYKNTTMLLIKEKFSFSFTSVGTMVGPYSQT